MDNEQTLGLPPGAFAKIDNDDDDHFYDEPRLVYHIDDGAVAALTEFYRTALPAGGPSLRKEFSLPASIQPRSASRSRLMSRGFPAKAEVEEYGEFP